ncbi:ABC transporter permease [Bacillus sp. FJAT-29937]|uniref:ABC transporter permease n=1 Tax=Bacillus sp. FJAT-29937 TaxID=1720553 RepID=UPI00082EDEAA|nr:ABC transporter permease [Bacillus sp. FJAT-29937]
MEVKVDVERNSVGFYQTKDRLKREQRHLLLKRFFSNKLAITGGIITLLLTVIAIFAPFIATQNPYEMVVVNKLQGPSINHWFGTDNFGRDLFSRVVYGTQVSMKVGFLVALITGILGTIIGLYASYYSFLDGILMRFCDAMMAFPAILLAIAIMAALGPTITNVVISISVVYTPYVARVVRSSALVIREQTYIEAMIAQGASSSRIIWRHMAINTMSPLIVQVTFIFAEAIILEAALSFLGVGVPAPDPTWGNILFDGKLFIFNAWWLTVFPGVFMILSVLGLNLFGDGLRDLLDPTGSKGKKK